MYAVSVCNIFDKFLWGEYREVWIFAAQIGWEPVHAVCELETICVLAAQFMLTDVLVRLIDEHDMFVELTSHLECRSNFRRVVTVVGVEVGGEFFKPSLAAGEATENRKMIAG